MSVNCANCAKCGNKLPPKNHNGRPKIYCIELSCENARLREKMEAQNRKKKEQYDKRN